MEVHVCDVTDSAGMAARNTLVAQKKKHVIELYGMSNGVTQMVKKIIEEAGDSMIDKLVIWGHGGPGSQGVSRGTESDRNADWAGIDIENLIDRTSDGEEVKRQKKLMRDTLRLLWDVLDYSGVVELHGCSVGSTPAGQVFLMALANIWEVPVRAGSVTQYGPNWSWAGVVHEAKPGMSGTTTFQGSIKVL
jgi:hypothetical protein